MTTIDVQKLQGVIEEAVELARQNNEGAAANYIPELASVPVDVTAIAVRLLDGTQLFAGDDPEIKVTLQSTAKLVVLIGLVEEYGLDQILQWTQVEPSGGDFDNISRLDLYGPLPANPMLNSGAISLSAHIPGNAEQKLAWLDGWMERLFGIHLNLDHKVYASERRTGDRNRALAYLLKSRGLLPGEVDHDLDAYFALCSYEATAIQASHLPMLLANGGRNEKGEQVISKETTRTVIAVMSTCGLYNETGSYMVKVGMPAKSGVSGYILASAMGHAGIAVVSPRVNQKGTSIRGAIMLEHLSKTMGWHFAC